MRILVRRGHLRHGSNALPQGTPKPRDLVLCDKEDGQFVLICCARSQSDLLVLDRYSDLQAFQDPGDIND